MRTVFVVARSFSVCGEITTLRPIDRILSFEAVHAQPHLSRDAVIRDNKFCILLESGEYKVSIFDAPQDKYQRLMFTPSEKVIQLKDFPITDLTFTQILGSVSGIVRCVVPCPNTLKISLLTGNGEAFSDMDTAGGFRFENVDLGTHMVKVVEPSKRFCWDLVQKTIELTTSKPTAVVGFKQTGFLFEVWSSHAAGIVYSLKGKAEKKQDQLKSGFTELCIPDAGKMRHRFSRCGVPQVHSTPLAFSYYFVSILTIAWSRFTSFFLEHNLLRFFSRAPVTGSSLQKCENLLSNR